MDCSAFLNWSEDQQQSDNEKAVVFRSIVATVKLQPVLDDALEVKAVKFLKSVDPQNEESADTFLNSLASNSDDSLTNFVQSIVVLTSSPNRAISTAVMRILRRLIWNISAKRRLAFFKADLITQLIIPLNPQSLSLSDCEDIHNDLIVTINCCLWLATPYGLEQLEIEDGNEQQAVHEIVLKQLLTPSEKYIRLLCVNRFSIISEDLADAFLALLSALIHRSPYHQRTMDFVLEQFRFCLTHRHTIPHLTLLPNPTRPSSPFLTTEEPKCFFMQINQFLFTLHSTRDADPTNLHDNCCASPVPRAVLWTLSRFVLCDLSLRSTWVLLGLILTRSVHSSSNQLNLSSALRQPTTLGWTLETNRLTLWDFHPTDTLLVCVQSQRGQTTSGEMTLIDNQISWLPKALLTSTLTNLLLAVHLLTHLPDGLSTLTNLQPLDVSFNLFEIISLSISLLTSLVPRNCVSVKIEAVQHELSRLFTLTDLILTHHKLNSPQIWRCGQIVSCLKDSLLPSAIR
ncbi:hypothetical protein BLNAU_4831 [Blattamonas nauphoetae]|uniref:Uncharacterized protein n=1 Tax=Blattamonas nauphoetae TaxID=2049346 RepID=A0ABQ9Y9B0_9EUKA|nr:hypothetical protein BLNAU_4831 [Blattamonas nauphoetae]